MVGAEAAIALIGWFVVPIIKELIRAARYNACKKLLSPKELRELDESLVEISKLLVDTERMSTRGDPTADMISLQLIAAARAAKSILDDPRTTGKAMESTVRLFAQQMRSILRKEKVKPTYPNLQLEESLQTSTRHATTGLPYWPTSSSTRHATKESTSSSWSSHPTTGSAYWPTSTPHGTTESTSSSWSNHATTGSAYWPTSTRDATKESTSSSWSNHATTGSAYWPTLTREATKESTSSSWSNHATTGSPYWPTSSRHVTTKSTSSSWSSHPTTGSASLLNPTVPGHPRGASHSRQVLVPSSQEVLGIPSTSRKSRPQHGHMPSSRSPRK